ncbi:MAG: S9 family peptidase [Longimicrobiales bacterium]
MSPAISPRRSVPVLLAVLATALAGAPAPAQEVDARDRLSVDRYLEWEFVNDPRLSPDGRQVLWEREWIDATIDDHATAIWIMDADGSRKRFLVDGSSPRWSPDGTRIAYVARDDAGGSQIFVRWMDAEGAVSQVTRVREGPGALAWSPDGTRIAFRMRVDAPSDPAWNLDMPARPEGADWTEAPRIVERLRYRADRSGWLPEAFQQLFVVSADGGNPLQITEGPYDHGAPVWTPDGRSLLFSGLRAEDAEHQYRESEIYSVTVASREVRQLTTRRGPDGDPLPSPDGRLIAYTGYSFTTDTYREDVLWVMNADGSGTRMVAEEMGGGFGDLTWAPDGRGLYYNAQMRGTSNLWYAPLDGTPRQVTEGDHMLSVTSIRGTTAVGVRSAATEPGAVVRFDTRTPNDLTVLDATNEAAMAEVELGEVEEIWYPSVDGLMIQGWIVKPPDFDPARRYPLILRIHGGPHVMYNTGFDFKNHNHAANGYVVLYTNPRGSSGYGSEFGNAIKNAYPSMDYDDLMVGVDSVVARGYIDERNLFVYGGSGGGVLTSWIVGHTDRFRAAVAKAPVTNWVSFVGTTDGPSWYYNFETLPWDDPSEHLRRSPLMYVGNVTTPTMLMTGERDLRTPMEQTEQYYRALKLRQVPTAMVRLTDGWHSRSWPPTNFIRVQLLLRNWFERFMVRDGEVAAGTGR